MVLSSQMSRSGSGRSNMFARRSHKKKPWLLIFIVVGLAAFGGWWFFLRESGGAGGDTTMTGGIGKSTRVAVRGSAGGGDVGIGDVGGGNTGGAQTNTGLTNNNKTAMLPSGGGRDRKTNESAGRGGYDEPRQEVEHEGGDSSITMGEANRTPPSDDRSESNANKVEKKSEGGVMLPDDSFGADPSQEVNRLTASADAMFTRGQLVEARRLYNEALQNPGVGRSAGDIRKKMGEINEGLIFSPLVADVDPYTERYVIQSGDRLVNLAKKAHVDWRFLARINNIEKPERIRIGQTIKIVNGPFHVVIDKSDYRMDVYVGNVDDKGRRMFVRSFPVGLGEYDSTPIGSWIVRKNSKAINPAWTNPRTGEHFSRDDPKNPVGEYWIGLRGLDSATSQMSGYGIHGTIDPGSIGRQSSMGCVRMRREDIALVYEMLVPGESTVITKP